MSCYRRSFRYPIIVLVWLSRSPGLQEILWEFNRSTDKRELLTLKNPDFYETLFESPKAYEDERVIIDPIEDFHHVKELYVLAGNSEVVSVISDPVFDSTFDSPGPGHESWQSFSIFWLRNNAIIFKGLSVLFLFFSLVSDDLLDTRGRLMGGGIFTELFRGRDCGLCKPLPLLVSAGPRPSRNRHGLQPIITEGRPFIFMGWPMHRCTMFGLCICIGRGAHDNLVRWTLSLI